MILIGEFLKGAAVLTIYLSDFLSEIFVIDKFQILLLSQLSGGLGYSFCAGSDGGFLFRYCNQNGLSEAYKTHEAKSASGVFISFLGAGIIGAMLTVVNIKFPFLLTSFAHIASFSIMYSCHSLSKGGETTTVKKQSNVLKEFNLPLVSNLLFYSVSRAIIMTIFIALLPIYLFVHLKISLILFGLIFALYSLTAFFVGKYTIQIRKKMGEHYFDIFLALCMGVSLLWLSIDRSIMAIFAPTVMFVVVGAIRPHSITRINALVAKEENRTTVISFGEMFFGLLNVLMILICFYFLERYNIYSLFRGIFVSAVILYSVLLSSLWLHRSRKQ
jgi:hypothetical protein